MTVVSGQDLSQQAQDGERPAARADTAWLRRPALVLVAALAGLSYAWALDRAPLEPYYAAAVRSMSSSWHNFYFGAFDPAGTITVGVPNVVEVSSNVCVTISPLVIDQSTAPSLGQAVYARVPSGATSIWVTSCPARVGTVAMTLWFV